MIEDVLRDPVSAAALAKRSRERAAEFTWERSAHLHAKLFAETLRHAQVGKIASG
jgi:hypothetical protein